MTDERKAYLRTDGELYVGTVVNIKSVGILKSNKRYIYVVRIVLPNYTVCEVETEKKLYNKAELMNVAVNVYVDKTAITRFGVQQSFVGADNYYIDLENVEV